MMILEALLKIIIFPGFVFLSAYSFVIEFVDRKLYARFQNRKGPPWYQPLADFLKLLGKQTLIPADANEKIFRTLPVFSLAAVTTVFIYIPVMGERAIFSFEGDIIVILYLLTMPALAMFLAGWYSRSLYATMGATRVLTQLYAYEVPMFMALLSPTLLSGTWSLSGTASYYAAHPAYILINLPVMLVSLVAIQCKLERTPFDAAEAETEIVGGPLVEYGGRYLAFFQLTKDCELTVMLSLFAAIFLPFMTGVVWVDFLLYLVKTMAVLFVLIIMRAVMARLRINQIVAFCWRYLTPVAILQMIVNLLLKGVLA